MKQKKVKKRELSGPGWVGVSQGSDYRMVVISVGYKGNVILITICWVSVGGDHIDKFETNY